MSGRPAGRGLSLLGVGAAACVACCAVPLLGFLAATGALTAAGVMSFGVVGLAVLAPAAIWWRSRGARRASARSGGDRVPVKLGPRP